MRTKKIYPMVPFKGIEKRNSYMDEEGSRGMQTADLLESIRADIKRGLREELLAELMPEIERRLYANIFVFEEAARYLRVSDRTLRRMTAKNEVPFFRQRGNLYFRQTDLDRHIAELVKKEARIG